MTSLHPSILHINAKNLSEQTVKIINKMEIEKEIDITVKIDLDDKDICEWIEERISYLDILMTDEGKEKMKPLKAKYYEKWMELYWFFQNPTAELKGEDPMPVSSREDAKNYFI